jgi:hypothetical protein
MDEVEHDVSAVYIWEGEGKFPITEKKLYEESID